MEVEIVMKHTKMMNPLSNTVFLGIFSHCDTNPEIEYTLRCLINAIIGKNRPQIAKINKVRSEDTEFGSYAGAKAIRIDLLVTDCNGNIFIIEIQLYVDYYMMKRNIVYVSRIIERQLESGDGYSKIKPVVMINIADFLLFNEADVPDFYNMANLTIKGTDYVISDDLTFFFVELPKFIKRRQADRPTELEIWLTYFLNYEDEAKRKELIEMNAAIGAFDKVYERMQDDDETWFKYEAERRSIEAHQTSIQTAIDQAMPDIIEQAKPIIIEQAKPIIIEQANKETALKLLSLDVDINVILASTGLSKECIEDLQKHLVD